MQVREYQTTRQVLSATNTTNVYAVLIPSSLDFTSSCIIALVSCQTIDSHELVVLLDSTGRELDYTRLDGRERKMNVVDDLREIYCFIL